MGDFRKRIGLIHKLGKLTAAEELTDGRHNRLGVDQVVRHGGFHLLMNRHFFLDRPFHPHQTDSELIFQQLPNGTNATVPQMVNIVHAPDTLLELQQITNDLIEVLGRKCPFIQRGVHTQFDVELHPAHS